MTTAERFTQLWYELFVRDLKARYKQTVLGGLWSLGSPLVELAVYTVVFGAVLQAPSDGAPYPLFAYVGVVMWTFVAGGVTRGTTSITSNSGLVSSVPFPKAAITLAAVSSALFDTFLSALFLGLALLYYQAPLTLHILWIVPIGLLLLTFVTGLALLLSALNVFYRDIHHVVGLGVRLWLFVTPVVYASSAVPERWRTLYQLNPLAGLFESVRLVLVQGRAPDWGSLAYPAVLSLTVLVGAVTLFRRTEPFFAEIV